MVNLAFLGAQTGDEGKGVKVAHYVKRAVEYCERMFGRGQEHDVLTYRRQGGANAGHTVERDGERYALHQMPSGILIARTYNLMGEGVFIHPRLAAKEIGELRSRGIKIDSASFGIASNAHVTLDYHVDMDAKDSAARTGHTSTGKGIKPTAVDKYGRVGIRFEEFLDRSEFIEALKRRFPGGMPEKFGSYENFADSYAAERGALADFSVLQSDVMIKPWRLKIEEGAQGFILDVDKGLYPGVSSSNPAIVPVRTDRVVGVVKMYESSVGDGDRPFVGRMAPDIESHLRDAWGEFGTTTRKPRGLGWFDAVAVRHAVDSSGIDYLMSTCGDRLEELARMNEKARLITGYKIDGKTFNRWDKSFHKRSTLYRAEPVFEEFDAWSSFFDREKGELTPNAQRFVDRIRDLTGKEFVSHGFGPAIDDVFEVKDIIFSK